MTLGHWPWPRVMSILSNGLDSNMQCLPKMEYANDHISWGCLWPRDLRKLELFSCALLLEKSVGHMHAFLVFSSNQSGSCKLGGMWKYNKSALKFAGVNVGLVHDALLSSALCAWGFEINKVWSLSIIERVALEKQGDDALALVMH